MDPCGHAHLTWYGSHPTTGGASQIWYADNASGSWSAPQQLTSAAGSNHQMDPQIAVDPSGSSHLTWRGIHPTDGGAQQIWYSKEHGSPTWYLAEGYTGGDFDTWVLVQNQGTEEAQVTLDFQVQGGSAPPFGPFTLPAGGRQSVNLDILPGLSDAQVSTRVCASRPVVAERAVYFTYRGKSGGTTPWATPPKAGPPMARKPPGARAPGVSRVTDACGADTGRRATAILFPKRVH